MISENEAIQLVKSTSKYAHALMVSAMMAEVAKELEEDLKLWKIVGLLHDIDYDEVGGDMRKHGVVAAEKLKGVLPEEAVYSIKAHDYRTGFEPKSKLDKALIAADSATVLIEKMRGTGKELTAKTLLAEITNTSAAAPWHRNNTMKCAEIGLSLDKFLKICLNAMEQVAQP